MGNWSGVLSFEKCIQQLEKTKEKEPNRPVLVKIPAGFTTQEQRFITVEDAIMHVKYNDPKAVKERQEKADAEEKKNLLRCELLNSIERVEESKTQAVEATAAEEATKKSYDDEVKKSGKEAAHPCEWMYG